MSGFALGTLIAVAVGAAVVPGGVPDSILGVTDDDAALHPPTDNAKQPRTAKTGWVVR